MIIADNLVVEFAPGGEPDAPSTWGPLWVRLTDDESVRNEESVTISAGRRDEGQSVDASVCRLTLDNTDGRFTSSKANPNGVYYPHIGPNVPLRIRWDELSVANRGFEGGLGTWAGRVNATVAATTAQAKTGTQSMSVTAVTAADASAQHVSPETAGHAVTPGEVLEVAAWFRAATTPRSVQVGVNFYTAGGGFVSSQFASLVTDSSSAWTRSATTATVPATAATALAVVQVLAPAASEVHYVDDVSLGSVLFLGFVSEWPPKWDKTGNDAFVPIQADGILRRLRQRSKPIASALRTHALREPTPPTAYWPCEDADLATFAASAVDGDPLRPYVSGAPDAGAVPVFGSNQHPVGSTGAVDLVSGWAMQSPVAGTTSDWSIDLWFNVSAGFSIYAPDAPTIHNYRFTSNLQGYDLVAWDENGLSILNHTDIFGSFDPPSRVPWPDGDIGGVHHLVLTCDRLMIGSEFKLYLDGVEINSSGETFAPGPVSRLVVGSGTDRAYSHIAVWPSALTAAEVEDRYDAGQGWPGELAATRIARLCSEQGVGFTLTGTAADTMAMGPQIAAPFLSLLAESETADGGVLIESGGGLGYITRTARYNQPVALAVDVDAGHVADTPEPTDDDQQLTNSILVQRTTGGECTAEDAASVAEHGTYDASATVSIGNESDCDRIAGWLLHLGTVDEMRWPRIGLDLARNSALIATWLTLQAQPGKRLTVDHTITQLPGVDVDLLVDGWTQRIDQFEWDIELNCVPSSPWGVFVMDADRVHAAGSTLFSGVTASDTSLDVSTGNLLTANQISVETDLTGWVASTGCTLARTTDQAAHGDASIEVTSTSIATDFFDNEPAPTPVTVGKTYTGVAEFRAATAVRGCRISLVFKTAQAGSIIDTVNGATVEDTTTGWTQVFATGIAPATATVVEMSLQVISSATSEVHYADKMGLFEGTSIGLVWGTADLPFDIVIGGERITVTAITGASSPQTFTVTRSVNGISKAHDAGAAVDLALDHGRVLAL